MINQLMIKVNNMMKLEGLKQDKEMITQNLKNHFQLIAVDLSKKEELDPDPRAIQQMEFDETLGTKLQVCTILEKSKETVAKLYKGAAKVL